ncbi:MAG: hypothetical protein E6Q59_00300, partial [Nitrosomonas sp.]
MIIMINGADKMFFEAKIDELNNQKMLYLYEEDEGGRRVKTNGCFKILPDWFQGLQEAILSGNLRYSPYYGLCKARNCTVAHLKIPDPDCDFALNISECHCSNILGDTNRQHLIDIRQRVEKIVTETFKGLFYGRNQITITFACSGKL